MLCQKEKQFKKNEGKEKLRKKWAKKKKNTKDIREHKKGEFRVRRATEIGIDTTHFIDMPTSSTGVQAGWI